MLLAADLPPALVRVAAFVFGALWGSFFNVAIHRWPRGESVVHPPSHCPTCATPIPAWRNLPIVGWLLLRGRAACCGTPISARYLVVELLGALLAVAVAERFLVGAAPGAPLDAAAIEAFVLFVFVGGLLVATFVDLEWMEIPDEVSIPGAALGLATVALRTNVDAADAALGAGAGYLLVHTALVWGYEVLTGRRGMGEGDAKLMLFIGAFVGWQGALFAIVVGAVQGLVVAVPMLLWAGRTAEDAAAAAPPAADAEGTAEADAAVAAAAPGAEGAEEPPPTHFGQIKVPFGPFLALGALEYLFFGERLLAWYFGWFE